VKLNDLRCSDLRAACLATFLETNMDLALISGFTVSQILYSKPGSLILGTLKKASAAAFQGTGSDPL
jgi:hypothetical protein